MNNSVDINRPRYLSGALCLVLLLSVITSGLFVTYTVHNSQRIYRTTLAEQQKTRNLQVQWESLLLEYSARTSYARVENIARRDLDMIHPEIKDIVSVTYRKRK